LITAVGPLPSSPFFNTLSTFMVRAPRFGSPHSSFSPLHIHITFFAHRITAVGPLPRPAGIRVGAGPVPTCGVRADAPQRRRQTPGPCHSRTLPRREWFRRNGDLREGGCRVPRTAGANARPVRVGGTPRSVTGPGPLKTLAKAVAGNGGG
jgi:hypothetical protein